MSETNKAPEGAAGPGLTAADLDRLAAIITGPHLEEYGLYEIECRRCKATTSLEEYGVADSDVIALCSDCAFKVVEEVPAILALARRGLEADADPNFKRYVEASLRAESAESKLAAALAEIATLKAELAASEPPKADRCVNCAFGSRACRQCRDRAQLAAALAEVERVRGLLVECRPYVESAAAEQMGYGHFPGGDPRKFTPDEDGTLPEERKAWEEACAKAENVAPAGEWLPAVEGQHGGIHVTWTRFGLGVYTHRDEEAVALLAKIPAVEQAQAGQAAKQGGEGRT